MRKVGIKDMKSFSFDDTSSRWRSEHPRQGCLTSEPASPLTRAGQRVRRAGPCDAVAVDSPTAERAAGSGLAPNGTPFPAESGRGWDRQGWATHTKGQPQVRALPSLVTQSACESTRLRSAF